MRLAFVFKPEFRALFTDPQTSFLAKFSLKIGLTALFTHLKIILLQYFQFSTINDIQTDPKLLLLFFFNDD